ncbi:MAG: hypothetical protein AB7I59_05440 [Geminicoccaceae bacterium]
MSSSETEKPDRPKGSQKPAPGVPHVGRLDCLARVRREASRLYRDARQGRLSSADASRLASVLALIAALLRDGELEERLAALEEAQATGGTADD